MLAEARIRTFVLAAIVASSFVAAIPFFASNRVTDGVTRLKQAAERQNAYIDLLSMLRDVETGQRGFTLTRMDTFLEPYTAALIEIPSIRQELARGAMDPQEAEQVAQILSLTDLKLRNAASSIDARRKNVLSGPEALDAAAVGKAQMDKLRMLIGKQISAMSERRNTVRSTLISGSQQVAIYSALAALLNVVLLVTVVWLGRKILASRAAATEELEQAIATAEKRNALMAGSARMLQALESVSDLTETTEILQNCLPALLPGSFGTVYAFGASRDVLSSLACWGEGQEVAPITPKDCWGLRLGCVHHHDADHDFRCNHLKRESSKHHMCVPMVTQGNVIGVLSIRADVLSEADITLYSGIVAALAEQVSLALSNVMLREALRAQSIVDPLTGLYNRRFLDDTLSRELERAVRRDEPLSVIILDVDHFKRLNDTFGHDAGDAVLKAVASATKSAVRKADFVCRYGGEELVIVLPCCEQGLAQDRAEMIRKAIENLRLTHLDKELPQVTASLGVANFPTFALDADGLVRAADAALYVAKRRGRNNVQLAVDQRREAGQHP